MKDLVEIVVKSDIIEFVKIKIKNIKLYVYFCIFVIFINSYYIMKIKFILLIDNLMIYI